MQKLKLKCHFKQVDNGKRTFIKVFALKTKLKAEGSELSQKLGQLKMAAEDGKMRMTDVADTEQLFRLIQL